MTQSIKWMSFSWGHGRKRSPTEQFSRVATAFCWRYIIWGGMAAEEEEEDVLAKEEAVEVEEEEDGAAVEGPLIPR